MGSYREIAGIEKCLDRLEKRLSVTSFKEKGMEELYRNYQALEDDFKSYFPQLVVHTVIIKKDLGICR